MTRLDLAEKTERRAPLGQLVSELGGGTDCKATARSWIPVWAPWLVRRLLDSLPSRPVRHARNKEAVPQGGPETLDLTEQDRAQLIVSLLLCMMPKVH